PGGAARNAAGLGGNAVPRRACSPAARLAGPLDDAASPPVIRFQQVHKSYAVGGRQVAALHPLDLEIQAGEVFGIIGHSGAGKSTLIRLINLLEAPSGGQLWVDGQEDR